MSYFTATKVKGFRVAGTTADGRKVYYTGCAGQRFITEKVESAYGGYYQAGAEAAAQRLNRTTALHGVTFFAEEE